MNERIRELVRQAGLDNADFPIENWDNVPLAKFAELIVEECCSAADEWYQNHNDIHWDPATHILQRFGMES